MTSREHHSLSEPPVDPSELRGRGIFNPVGNEFVRAALRTRSTPWYFCNSGQGRFDLTNEPEMGTCHLASDDISALREAAIGPDYVGGTIVDRADLAQFSLWKLSPSTAWSAGPIADFGSDTWNGAGITNEVWTISDYELPQKWASALFRAGYCGVKAGLKLVLNVQEFGLAVFGPAGQQDADDRFPSQSRTEVSPEVI